MDRVVDIGKWIFVYCTDFIINVANLTGTSYYEVNAFLFVILWPVLTVFMFLYFVYLKWKVSKLEG